MDMAESAPENMDSRRKVNVVPDNPKSMISQALRTPLMDVKNQFSSRAKQRKSTGSVKNSGLSFRNRLSLNDQQPCYTQRTAQFFKQQDDEDGKVTLVIPKTHPEETENHQENDPILTSLSSNGCALHETLGELSICPNEVSRDGELLKEVMSVLDQDLQMPDDSTEEVTYLEQDESFALISNEYSNVESTQEILSDIRALEFDDSSLRQETETGASFEERVVTNCEAGDNGIDASMVESDVSEQSLILCKVSSGVHLQEQRTDLQECQESDGNETSSDEASTIIENGSALQFSNPETSEQSTNLQQPIEAVGDVSLPSDEMDFMNATRSRPHFSNSTISEQSETLLVSDKRAGDGSIQNDEMIETDSELLESVTSFEYLSSSLRDPLSDTDILLASSADLELNNEDIHELSSIRFVEGYDDSTLDALLERTLTGEMKNDFDLSTNHPEVEEITATLERLSQSNLVNNECSLSKIMSIDGSAIERKMDSACRCDLTDAEARNELFCDSEALVDLAMSETEVLNCFDCTSDMSKFINEFLKETPVVQVDQAGLMQCRPQTVGKREDMWPDEHVENNYDFTGNESSIFETTQTSANQQSLENVGMECIDVFSLEKDLCIEGMISGASGTIEQLSGVDQKEEIEKGYNTVLLDEDLTDKDNSNGEDTDENSCIVCDEEVVGAEDELPSDIPEPSMPKMIQTQVNSKPGDLYLTRVSKVLETLRGAYVVSDHFASVQKHSDLEMSTEILKPHGRVESFNEKAEEEVPQDLNTDTNVVKSDTSVTSTLTVEEPNPVKERLLLNRSTIEMQEEIKSLEYQMKEMKEKVAWLECQIECHNQENGEDHSPQNCCESDQPQNVSAMHERKGIALGANEAEFDDRKKLIDELEVRLSEELVKMKDQEGHVKDLEKKCSLLEKERLNSELHFARELKRLKSEYTQSIGEQRAEEEQKAEIFDQEFDCMISEFERLTTLQKKLKDMLNRVMKTTNESLAGYAKLLKDYSKLQENNKGLEAQISISKADNKKLNTDVEVLESLLLRSNDSIKDLHELYQEEIQNLKSQVESLSEAQGIATKEKEASKKGLEESVDKLQCSVDRLETERQINQEELEDTRFLLEHQKTKNQTLSEEIDELRKIKVDWVAGQDLIKELQDTLSFLNEERNASVSEYQVSRKQITALEDQVDSLTAANEEYQKSQDQLQTEVSGLKEQLYVTSEDSNLLLAALEEIESKAESLLDTLQQKFAIELSYNSAKATPKQIPTEKGASSLVAQVLSKVEVEAGQRPSTCSKLFSIKKNSSLRQSNVEYGSVKRITSVSSGIAHDQTISVPESHAPSRVPSSRKALDFSSPLITHPPKEEQSSSQILECNPVTASQDNSDALNASIPGFAHIRSIPMSGKEEKEENISSGSEDCNVVAMCESVLLSIEQKFSMILRIAHTADRTSKLKFRDLKGEVELLNEKYRMKRGLAEKLDAELQSKRHQLGNSRDEVDQLNERVNRMTKAILKHEDMNYEVKRLKEDNRDLQEEMTNLKGERDMLSNQVQDLIAKVSRGEGDQASLKKLAALEKKYYQLHRFMLQEQEKNTEKGDKAMRRMRVLEMNLKRAEEEVYKFDELVEAIRNTCIENRSMRPHPVLLHVVRLIDGLVEVESSKSGAGKTKGPSKQLAASLSKSASTKGVKEEYPV